MSEIQPSAGEAVGYDEALRICGREARATLAAAVLTMLFFWGAVWLLGDSKASLMGLPLWFVVAAGGGYLFSIAAVLWIVRRNFRAIPLDIPLDRADAAEGARR